MSEIITISDVQQILIINEIIHDAWFDKKDIVFDFKESVLSIRFEYENMKEMRTIGKTFFFNKVKKPIVECFLKVFHVKDYSIIDRTGEAEDCFYELLYDVSKKSVKITSGLFQIEINIQIEKFEVSVEITDNVLWEEETLAFLADFYFNRRKKPRDVK